MSYKEIHDNKDTWDISKPSRNLSIGNKHPAAVQGVMVSARPKRRGSDLEAASKREKQDSFTSYKSGSETKMDKVDRATEEVKFTIMLARAFKMECVSDTAGLLQQLT